MVEEVGGAAVAAVSAAAAAGADAVHPIWAGVAAIAVAAAIGCGRGHVEGVIAGGGCEERGFSHRGTEKARASLARRSRCCSWMHFRLFGEGLFMYSAVKAP